MSTTTELQLPARRLLTNRQLAEYLSVSVRTVQRLTASGAIPVIYVRSLPRYDAQAVEEALMRDGMPTE